MSSEAWAIQTMKKYKLAVDFCLEYVETSFSEKFYWEENGKEDSYTFEEALQMAIDCHIRNRGE